MRINHGQLGRGWSDYVPSMDSTKVVVMIMIILIINKKKKDVADLSKWLVLL